MLTRGCRGTEKRCQYAGSMRLDSSLTMKDSYCSSFLISLDR